MEKLHKLGINTKMFTGNKKEIAEKIAKQVGIQAVKAEMLPQDKYNELDKIIEQREENKKVAFVGDGINDSPALTNEAICVSVKSVTDISRDSSDVILTKNDLNSILKLIKISEITELVEREKKLDALRWNWMEDAIFFDYFTIERIFAFLLKLEMIERWISLDKERGNQLFRSIIESLKNEVQIPAEFR